MQGMMAPVKGLEGFDEFIQGAMEAWTLPGLAVAVVRAGEVIHSRGYGLRDIERNLEVTPRTIMPIGSCTKAFTATALGILVDDGKLDWDKPVREYLPAFKLWDPVATEAATAWDLLTHRTGLARHEFMWYGATATRRELFDRLRYLEPNKGFRQVWQYSNLMYMTAGILVEAISGMSWEEFIRSRILEPLSMRSSTLSIEEMQAGDDFSHGYDEKDGKPEYMPFMSLDAIGPAGSINSSVDEMTRWLLLQMNGGKAGETQIVSEAVLRQIHAPHMVIEDRPDKYTELQHTAYSLGWAVQSYRGHTLISHTGGIDGFIAQVAFLPDDKIGVVALSNRNNNLLPNIVAYNVADRLLGLDEVPWNDRMLADIAEMKEAAEKASGATAPVPNTHPSHDLADYSGSYEHPGYGTLTVGQSDGTLEATFNGMTFPLNHHHYDIFDWDFTRFGVHVKATFLTNIRGDIDRVAVGLEATVGDIVFTRVAAAELRDTKFLQQFTGEYDVMGMTATVTLKGEGALTLTLPGQPEYELEPYKGTIFNLKGLSGFSVEFTLEDGGAVTEAVVTQPNGAVTATKRG